MTNPDGSKKYMTEKQMMKHKYEQAKLKMKMQRV